MKLCTRRILSCTVLATLLCCSRISAQFVDVSASVGLLRDAKKSWGNPIWGDMNNDGFLDLIVPDHGLALSHGPFVYLNNGGTQFIDNLTASNIKQAPAFDTKDWHGFAFGDYDGDGALDLYVAEGAKGNKGGALKQDLLFHGGGNGSFTNVSNAAGMQISLHRGRCALFFDYNNDGKLDLFVKNYGDANDLYQNQGNGIFVPVPGAAGLADATSGVNKGSILGIADFDNDGFMDIAFTGDGNAQALYRNQGDGTFVDVTATSLLGGRPDGKGIAWGDYNNDGFVDLFIARGLQGSAKTTGSLYQNNGDGTFTDVSAAAGVQLSGTSWSAVWGDFDNDGYLDLFVPNAGNTGRGPGNANHLFRNNGNGTFTDVAAAEGVAMQDDLRLHKAAAWADYDNDGFLDLIVKDGIGNEQDNGAGSSGLHTLFRNTPNGNHFIKVSLLGVQSTRQGIGARVTVTTNLGFTCYRQNTGDGGGNYFSQGSVPLHFGIGQATSASVNVSWPSNVVDTIDNVPADSSITAVEGGGSPPPTPTPSPSPPVITRQPANRTVNAGQSARFSVTATGESPLSYQWRKNDADIAGATDSVYNTPPAGPADSGSAFNVVVSNSGGSVTSKTVQLMVNSTHRPN
jgi:hypothetical protein